MFYFIVQINMSSHLLPYYLEQSHQFEQVCEFTSSSPLRKSFFLFLKFYFSCIRVGASMNVQKVFKIGLLFLV